MVPRMPLVTGQHLIAFQAYCRILQTRIAQNKAAYTKWSQLARQQSAGRYVGSGLKIHDLGPVQSQQGQILSTHLGPDFLPALYQAAFTSENTAYLYILNNFGIWGLFAAGMDPIPGGPSDTDLTRNSTNYWMVDKVALVNWIKSVADDNQVPLGNKYQEFITGDGVSLRSYTGGTDRPFTTFSPPVLFDSVNNVALINRQYINRQMNANGYPGNDFFDDYIMPVFVEQATLIAHAVASAAVVDLTSFTYAWSSDSSNLQLIYNYVSCNFQYKIGSAEPVTASFLMMTDKTGVPVCCYRHCSICGLDNQADAPFMIAFLLSQATNRPFKTYGQTYEEIQPQAGSVLGSTPSPQDASWREVVKVSSGFPSIVKGFTFFSKLWDGVKDSVKWVGKNAGSIIRLGKTVASALA